MGNQNSSRLAGQFVRKPFRSELFRESFKDRGIDPVNDSKIVESLTNQLVIPDLYAPDLRLDPQPDLHTLSPPPDLSSSSVENTPPDTIDALERN